MNAFRIFALLALTCGLGCRACSAEERLLLSAAHVHPVSGPTLAPGFVLIVDGKIQEVASRIDARGAQLIDLGDLHLYPALVAVDTSLGLTEIGAVRATEDSTEVGDATPEVESWIAVNADSELLAVARAGGIATFEAVPVGSVVAGQSGVLSLTGWTWEEMKVSAPAALHVYWPSMSLDLRPDSDIAPDPDPKEPRHSPAKQAAERQRRIDELREFFEEARAYHRARAADGIKANAIDPSWESLAPYLSGQLPVVVHADELRQVRALCEWAEALVPEERPLRFVLAGARDAWMLAPRLAALNIPVIYERTFGIPDRDTEAYDSAFAAPAVLHAAGVRVSIGLGAGSWAAADLRNLPHLAAMAVAFGLPPEEGVRAITENPARALGLAERLGTLEAGKDATLIATTGDILDLRTQTKRMWIAGKEVTLESRHTKLHDRYRDR